MRGRCVSAGTGVRLCDFITLHANSDRGRPRRQKTEGERGRERSRRGMEMDRVRPGEEKDGVMTELQALCLYMHLQAN